MFVERGRLSYTYTATNHIENAPHEPNGLQESCMRHLISSWYILLVPFSIHSLLAEKYENRLECAHSIYSPAATQLLEKKNQLKDILYIFYLNRLWIIYAVLNLKFESRRRSRLLMSRYWPPSNWYARGRDCMEVFAPGFICYAALSWKVMSAKGCNTHV